MNLYRALQTKALLAVLEPDHAALMRSAMRFYSKTFHVPLPDVLDMNEEEVLSAYYEESFERMSPEEQQEFVAKLSETPEETALRETEEEKGKGVDEEFYTKLNAEVREGQIKGPPKNKPRPAALARALAPVAVSTADTTNPEPAEPQSMPDISMKFGDNLLAEVGDLDPLSPSLFKGK